MLIQIYKFNYITFTKIAIILFVGITLLLYSDPFFERSNDSYLYGFAAIRISEGQFTYSNELLEDTGQLEFVPRQWLQTIHGEVVPGGTTIGFSVIGSIIYKIFGIYGLFYFGPISAIILLIVAERITNHLFDKKIALLTLLFLGTSEMIMYVGRLFLTDNFFTIFFILGCFYLIKFYRDENEKFILLSSIFFAFSTFIRLNGLISFPIEIVVILFYLIKKYKMKNSYENHNQSEFKNKIVFKKNILSKSLFLKIILPWLFVIIFILSYNMYYFGDGFASTSSKNEEGMSIDRIDRGYISSIGKTPLNERIENLMRYSNAILPSPINRIEGIVEDYDSRIDVYYPLLGKILKSDSFVETNPSLNLGLISLLIISVAVISTKFSKQYKNEILIYSIFISVYLLIFSSRFLADRFMLPTLPLFFGIISCLIFKFYRINELNNKYKKYLIKILKIILVISIILFFSLAIYFSEQIQIFKMEGLEITDPVKKATHYPINHEGLNKNSIIIGALSLKIMDYGFIPFTGLLGHSFHSDLDPQKISEKSINILKETISKGYDVYVFKEPQSNLDKPYVRYLVENHNFIVKDHSESFCKLEFDKKSDRESDKICLSG